ncbi:Kelch repeat type 1-containing protein [Caldicellulosiruptor owensensis OL]|uniref:Kelch repeat type 1-containing protein n=1 Tax=Caldicellulosiruptor owensensis (strain ATCC 700167 / DSM 13100 / OL) TaxID=632518 RepID=E4Q636_CALOW|nr:hypothetical protein [Caldicellulosiruptor owensensis]ADQ04410.1 Kelch repeat type 1-containing protein [Caldicellulosiruptor owensensis OL]
MKDVIKYHFWTKQQNVVIPVMSHQYPSPPSVVLNYSRFPKSANGEGFGYCVHNGNIIRIGGYSGSILSNVMAFNFSDGWRQVGTLYTNRGGAISANGYVYYMGGYANVFSNAVLRTTDFVNWTNIGNAAWAAREDIDKTTIFWQNTIYVFGGRAGSTEYKDAWKGVFNNESSITWTKIYDFESRPVRITYDDNYIYVLLMNKKLYRYNGSNMEFVGYFDYYPFTFNGKLYAFGKNYIGILRNGGIAYYSFSSSLNDAFSMVFYNGKWCVLTDVTDCYIIENVIEQ